MSVPCIYFDTYTNWEKFSKYTTNPTFLEFVDLWKIWSSINNDEDVPLMQSFAKIMDYEYGKPYEARRENALELTDAELEEIDSIIKCALTHGKEHPSWWCPFHDCVESSALLMAPLVAMAENKSLESVYICNIHIGKISHQVVCNKFIEPGTELDFNFDSNTPNDDSIVIYDLIFPTVAKICKDFNICKTGKVVGCNNFYKNFVGMNYTCMLKDRQYNHLYAIIDRDILQKYSAIRFEKLNNKYNDRIVDSIKHKDFLIQNRYPIEEIEEIDERIKLYQRALSSLC
jgi:hypothetical protein